jgi:carbamate kinase
MSMTSRTMIVALGGNALAPTTDRGTIEDQFRHTRESLATIVDLARDGWRLAIVHGNGPQVGDALVQQEMARHLVPPLPLGVLVAATQGWIGYMIQQSLQNALAHAGVDRKVVTLVTQTVVDPGDPSLAEPSKPVGRTLDEETSSRLAEELGWRVARSGSGWRRVVASPTPVRIVERDMIRSLVEAGHVVIAAGGGGAPVYVDPALGFEGVDAVVDKDRAAAVLARDLGAELLLILTDVEGVYTDFGTSRQRLIRDLSLAEAESVLRSGALGAGSMQPKVEAAIQFVREEGGRAIIASLQQAAEAVAGRAGTGISA